MTQKNKTLIIAFLVIIILGELFGVRFFFAEKERLQNDNSLVNQISQTSETLNKNVLSPLKSIKKIFFYNIFGFLPAYCLIIIIVIAFLIGQYLKFKDFLATKNIKKNKK